MRGNYPVLPGNRASRQGGCTQAWKQFCRKFTENQMEKEQNLLSGPAIPQTDRVRVHLCYPSPGGHEEEVAWWEEGTQLADGKRSALLPACGEASISGNSTASEAAFFPGLEMPARWGTRSHPKTKYDQGVSQGKREQRRISLQTGDMVFTCCTDPASFSQSHPGERCPGERRREVLEGGVCHLLFPARVQPC